MAADYSWIAPATGNIANLFGLNPEAAAKGRAMQAEQEYNAARTANTVADTGLSDYRRRLLEAQAASAAAQAGKYGADTGKTNAETEGLGITNRARTALANALASGAASYGEDGSLIISPDAVNTVGSSLAAMDANPDVTMKGLRGLGAMAGKNARVRAQAGGIAGIFRPDAATTAEEGQQIMGADQAARTDRAVEVAKVRGSIAQSIANSKGGQPGQPNQMELNRQAEGIKAGAEWAMKVPFQGGFLDEGQAYQLAQAARAANPSLNPQDAITKFVRDNPGMMKQNYELFGQNKVDIQGGIPATVPAAPAARPMAPAPAAAPAAQAAPAQGGMPTKSQFAALPEGGSVMVGGVKYVKQGRQLVPAK